MSSESSNKENARIGKDIKQSKATALEASDRADLASANAEIAAAAYMALYSATLEAKESEREAMREHYNNYKLQADAAATEKAKATADAAANQAALRALDAAAKAEAAATKRVMTVKAALETTRDTTEKYRK